MFLAVPELVERWLRLIGPFFCKGDEVMPIVFHPGGSFNPDNEQ